MRLAVGTHVMYTARTGNAFPAIVVQVHGDGLVGLQVFTPVHDGLRWEPSVPYADPPTACSWRWFVDDDAFDEVKRLAAGEPLIRTDLVE